MEATQHVVVVGGGTMGTGIATAFAAAGDEVTVVEAAANRMSRIVSDATAILEESVRRGKQTPEKASEAAGRLSVMSSLNDVAPGPDLAIEAVPERMPLKRQVLAGLETLQPRLLASNTSGLSIDRLAEGLVRPQDFLGLHFFNPVAAMPLIEVVLGARTAAAARSLALVTVERIGKEAVVVCDRPGFASSRLGIVLAVEAIRMVEEGVAEPGGIDRAMELGYRHPMGPLRLTDVVGLDVRLDIATHLATELGERFRPPELLYTMVEQGKLGRKSGEGFYRWPRDP